MDRCFRCTACGFEVWHNVGASVSALLVDATGKLAVVVRAKDPGAGLWTLPGGFAEPGEDAETAVRREVLEETGLSMGAVRYVGAWPNGYVYAGIEYPTLDLVFVSPCVGEAEGKPDAETAELLWVDRSELVPERFAFGSLATAVARWLEVDA